MADPLPPDPYIALGVPKDATAAAIKTQYRKLVLKFHPDKVQDESQKEAAADQFHKIQTAYEIASDEARRARYDAQYKLQELRKDVIDKGARRHSSEDDRSPRYAPEPARDFPPRERGSRVSPQYSTEERRPSYAPQDYFDPEPRTTSRKDAEYERSSKRAPAREERTKSSKASSVGGRKKDERSSRKEKSRRTEREVRQDRRSKFATATVEEASESDSDPYERRRRQMREDDELRRVQQQYHEHERKQREQADQGYFGDERTRKLFNQSTDARDYIGRAGRTPRPDEPEVRPPPVRMASTKEPVEHSRRPSPSRMSSSKDNVEYIRRGEKPAVMIRRGSGRPQVSGHPSDRRPSLAETVDEPARDAKRPPTLAHAKSSPPEVRPDVRAPTEKQRSYSIQMDANDGPPIPKMRRAETMPYTRHKESVPEKSSRLRHGDSAYPTPETSPERQPDRQQPRKFDYGRTQAYTDDADYASPDGYEVPASSSRYETEERKPSRPTPQRRDRYAEEPAVAKDSRRSVSAKHGAQPPPLPRASSTQYVYRDGEAAYVRPGPTRENSSRLYGEISTTARSPAASRSRYSPPAEAGYMRDFTAESVNMQSGFKTKERPGMPRRDTRQAVR